MHTLPVITMMVLLLAAAPASAQWVHQTETVALAGSQPSISNGGP